MKLLAVFQKKNKFRVWESSSSSSLVLSTDVVFLSFPQICWCQIPYFWSYLRGERYFQHITCNIIYVTSISKKFKKCVALLDPIFRISPNLTGIRWRKKTRYKHTASKHARISCALSETTLTCLDFCHVICQESLQAPYRRWSAVFLLIVFDFFYFIDYFLDKLPSSRTLLRIM